MVFIDEKRQHPLICHFHTRTSWLQLGISRIFSPAKEYLFVGRYLQVTWWAVDENEKEGKMHRMITIFILGVNLLFKGSMQLMNHN